MDTQVGNLPSGDSFAAELRRQVGIAECYRQTALREGDADTAELALGRIADLLEIAGRNDLVPPSPSGRDLPGAA